jgi:hypothetical protein
MKLIMNDPDFPAGFELFPAPAYRSNAIFDVHTGPLDIYDPGVAAKFTLSAQNQATALASWPKLDFSNRPKGVSYISIAGTGLQTENAYYYDNTLYRLTSSVDGDGTVPSWSASHGAVDKLYTMPGDHVGVMNTNQFRQTFYEIFNSTLASTAMAELAGKPSVSVSLHKRDLKAGESVQVLLIPDHPATQISGKLQIRRANLASDGTSMSFASIGADVPVNYEGPRVASLPVTIRAPETAGAYVLRRNAPLDNGNFGGVLRHAVTPFNSARAHRLLTPRAGSRTPAARTGARPARSSRARRAAAGSACAGRAPAAFRASSPR